MSQQGGAFGGPCHGREVFAVHIPQLPVSLGFIRGAVCWQQGHTGGQSGSPVVDVAGHQEGQLQNLQKEVKGKELQDIVSLDGGEPERALASRWPTSEEKHGASLTGLVMIQYITSCVSHITATQTRNSLTVQEGQPATQTYFTVTLVSKFLAIYA